MEDKRERLHLLQVAFAGSGTATTLELPTERGNLIRPGTGPPVIEVTSDGRFVRKQGGTVEYEFVSHP